MAAKYFELAKQVMKLSNNKTRMDMIDFGERLNINIREERILPYVEGMHSLLRYTEVSRF